MFKPSLQVKKKKLRVIFFWALLGLSIYIAGQLGAFIRILAIKRGRFNLLSVDIPGRKSNVQPYISVLAAILGADLSRIDKDCLWKLQENTAFTSGIKERLQKKDRQKKLIQFVEAAIKPCARKPFIYTASHGELVNNNTDKKSLSDIVENYLAQDSTHHTLMQANFNKQYLLKLHSTPCITDLSQLRREISINFSLPAPKMADIEYQFPQILIGGVYLGPMNCRPRETIAIIIPFRDREEHLRYWLHYTLPILIIQQLEFTLFVVEQEGNGVFNKGQLMNTAFLWATMKKKFNCFIFQDVDMIPQVIGNLYKCTDGKGVRHLAPFVDRFNYKINYTIGITVGGAIAFTEWQYRSVNGYSNIYWGWGGEDDDMNVRLKSAGLHRYRPVWFYGRYKMIPHKRDIGNPVNMDRFQLINGARRRMYNDGLTNLRTKITRITHFPLFTHLMARVPEQRPGDVILSNATIKVNFSTKSRKMNWKKKRKTAPLSTAHDTPRLVLWKGDRELIERVHRRRHTRSGFPNRNIEIDHGS